MIEYYKEGKLSHAYLIETNNIQKTYNVLLKVIKNIFCVKEYSDNCTDCDLCHLLNLNNLPSFEIIEPIKQVIKKEQINSLKEKFSKESLYTKEKIYVIKNADALNKESSNTMLKFLEEPSDNIIGFFITNNKSNMLPTIISRCELLSDYYEDTEISNIEISKEYLISAEKNEESILINKEYYDLDKKEIIDIFKNILNIYHDIFSNKYSEVDGYYINNKNILKKINLVTEVLQELNFNVNINMLLDKFVLGLEEINHESI